MSTAPHPTASRTILRLSAICRRLSVHSSTIYRWEKAGRFPQRVAIGANAIGWYEDEIDAWLNARQRCDEARRPSPNPKAASHLAPRG